MIERRAMACEVKYVTFLRDRQNNLQIFETKFQTFEIND